MGFCFLNSLAILPHFTEKIKPIKNDSCYLPTTKWNFLHLYPDFALPRFNLKTCHLSLKCQPLSGSSRFSYKLTSQGPEFFWKAPISPQSLAASLLRSPVHFFFLCFLNFSARKPNQKQEKTNLTANLSLSSTLFFYIILQSQSRYQKSLKTKSLSFKCHLVGQNLIRFYLTRGYL